MSRIATWIRYCCLCAALLVPALLHAQPWTIQGTVTDAAGKPVAGATIQDRAGHILATTTDAGTFEIPRDTAAIEVSDPHFVPVSMTIPAAAQSSPPAPLSIVLDRPLETVTVTAYRSPLASMDSPASTRVLSTQQLQQSTTPALDGKLRQVPGFELFRRTTSLVANPTKIGRAHV